MKKLGWISAAGLSASSLAVLVCLTSAAAGTRGDDGARPEDGKAGLAKGSYQIRNVKFADSDMVLRPRGASNREKTPIVLYPRTDWKCLTWKVEPADEGARLINHFTSKTFEPADSARDSGSQVLQVTPSSEPTAEQRWKFIPLGGDLYRIEHAATGKALTADKDGDEIQIRTAPWDGRDEQKWQVLAGPTHFSG
ncbi:RICIN domain-containing protein [Aquisphaera insulae]|uniref:RICIN domain-containing protein n=1 Tax=Aquisphaera insulae TaxID=2712864 RepID=UPI0013EC5A81|nr:RICIN domain-containing protein [Aquisphaera insulae]